jgi:hypothetical protein
VEYAAIAPAALFSHPSVFFEHNDAERPVSALARKLPGNGTPHDPCADDADVI